MPAAKKPPATPKTSKKTATVVPVVSEPVLNTFTVSTYECEHTGDLERDLDYLVAAGLKVVKIVAMEDFNGLYEVEEGGIVFTTLQDEATVRGIVKACKGCINGVSVGNNMDRLRDDAESEAYDRAEEERRDEEGDDY